MSFGGGHNATVNVTSPVIGNITLQTSAYGKPLPWIWGKIRVSPNLIWYGDFTAVPHVTESTSGGGGGKGGGGGSTTTQTTTYSYTAAILFGLIEGGAAGGAGVVSKLWSNKLQYRNLSDLGLTAFNGSFSQSPFGYMTTYHPGQALAYRGVAYLAASAYQLDNNAAIGNLSAEMSAALQYGSIASLAKTVTADYVNQLFNSVVHGFTTGQCVRITSSGTNPTGLSATTDYYVYNATTNAFQLSLDMFIAASSDTAGVLAPFTDNGSGTLTVTPFIPDANLKDVLSDFLTNVYCGVGFPAAQIGDLTALNNYCIASGTFISPCLDSQRQAVDFLKELAAIAYCGLVFSENVLKVVPYFDSVLTANGAVFTPNLTPAYALIDDYFLRHNIDGDKIDPVYVERIDPADSSNVFQVSFKDRSNQYNKQVVELQDQVSIDTYGIRTANVSNFDAITVPSLAKWVASLMILRAQNQRNKYYFRLPMQFLLLEPMDLVTLTEGTGNGLNNVTVRLTEIEEDASGCFNCVAEDAPAGAATAARYTLQNAGGFNSNFNADPGNVVAPAFMEAPAINTTSGLSVGVAVTGNSALWGGCEVWVSSDGGASYSRMGTQLGGGSRYGYTTQDSGLTYLAGVNVQLAGNGGVLLGGTLSDAQKNATLSILGDEYCDYSDSVLIATNNYTLALAQRGVYNTIAIAHPAGSQFARVDSSIIWSDNLNVSLVGSSLLFKFLSFNIYGFGKQSLSSVHAYSYQIRGLALLSPLSPITGLSSSYIAEVEVMKWTAVADFRALDYEIRRGADAASGIVLGRTPLPEFRVAGDGTYWIATHYKLPGGTDLYSTWTTFVITGSVLTSNVIASHEEAPAWPGTVSGYALVLGSTVVLTGTENWLTVADFLADANVLFGTAVGTPGTYTIPVSERINLGRVAPCTVVMTFAAVGADVRNNVLTLTDYLGNTDILNAIANTLIGAQLQIRTADATAVYGAWQNYYGPGTYNAQYFDAQIILSSTDSHIYPILSEFSISVDAPDRIDTGTNVAVGSGGTAFTFTTPFNGGPSGAIVPNIQVTILNATAGDDIILNPVSLSAFTLQIKNGGSGVARNVSWIAQGY